MRSIHVAAVGLFFVSLVAGCYGQQVIPSPVPSQAVVTPTQPFGQNWFVNLIVTGGFAGIQRSMELSSSGELRVVDDRSDKQVTQSISATELTKFSSLVSEIVEVKNDSLPPCADCFVYQLFIRRDNSMFSTTLNDVNLQESGLSELIDQLMILGNKALGN